MSKAGLEQSNNLSKVTQIVSRRQSPDSKSGYGTSKISLLIPHQLLSQGQYCPLRSFQKFVRTILVVNTDGELQNHDIGIICFRGPGEQDRK